MQLRHPPAPPLLGYAPAVRRLVAALFLTLGAVASGETAGTEAPGEFLVTSWHTEDGLPDGNVTAIAQTPEGYWWLGTFKGLARFDGVRFTEFDVRRGNALPDARVGALRVDRQGRLWIGFASGHLAYLKDGKCQVVEPCDPRLNPSALLAPDWATGTGHSTHSRRLRSVSLVEDTQGALWFHAGGDALLRMDGSRASLFTPTNGLPAGNIHSLVGDSAGSVWLLAQRGLHRWTNGGWSLQAEVESVPLDEIVFASSARESLLASVGRRVQRFRTHDWEGGFEPAPGALGSQRSQVTALMEDNAGRVWLGTHWSGVLYADSSGHWQRPVKEGPLAQCRVLTLFADSQDTLWVGTLGDGLFRLTRRAVAPVHLPAPAEGHLINTVCAARDGSVWAGTDGAGAFRVAGGKVEHFGPDEGLPGAVVSSVLEDRRTNLWLGTSAGLFRLAHGEFQKLQGFPAREDGVLAQFESRDGTLWFASPRGPVSFRDGRFTLHRLFGGQTTVEIRSFAQDRDDNLWVGTIGKGLFCLRGDTVVRYGPAEGLTHPDARSICTDSTGGLWVGTLGGGLFRFAEGRFQALTTADGLPDDTINGILEDDDGNLWLSSYNGFFGCARGLLAGYQRGASSPLVFRWLSISEGLDYRTCSGAGQPVVSRSPDGRLWFANQRSLAVFDPRVLMRRVSTPTVFAESLAADGVELPFGMARHARASSATRRFEVHYTALKLAQPEQARFRHRLRGSEEEWTEAGVRRVAYYGHLPPGAYDFEVMAAGPDGIWHAAAPLKLEVVPRFAERPAVQVLAVVLFIGAVVTVVYSVSRARMRRRLLLLEMRQTTERERRRIARDLHDDLGGTLTEITMLADTATGNTPEDRALAEVRKKADGLVQALDEIVWAVNPRHDSVASLAEYLTGHAREFLRTAGVRLRLDLPREFPPIALTPEQRHGMFLAAKEVLTNVIRHARATEVHLRVRMEPAELKIVVEDDGCGFEPAQVPPGGNGLQNLRDRLSILGGSVQIRSEPGAGTTVELILRIR